MNKLTIIGNLTKDPEIRTTTSNLTVCNFTVAVNRRSKNGNNESDFFRVSVWRQLGEVCAKYLSKGKKVCVIGPVSCSTYQGSDGTTRASMEIVADDIEFLSPRDAGSSDAGASTAKGSVPGMTAVEVDELPF